MPVEGDTKTARHWKHLNPLRDETHAQGLSLQARDDTDTSIRGDLCPGNEVAERSANAEIASDLKL